MLQKISDEAGTLVNWVAEMQGINSNPYSAGLNVTKMLEDLQGFAAQLVKDIYALEQELNPTAEEESSEAKSATVEQ